MTGRAYETEDGEPADPNEYELALSWLFSSEGTLEFKDSPWTADFDGENGLEFHDEENETVTYIPPGASGDLTDGGSGGGGADETASYVTTDAESGLENSQQHSALSGTDLHSPKTHGASAHDSESVVESVHGRSGVVSAQADDYAEHYAPLEEGVARGPIADRPTSGPYDDYLYVATDQGVTWQWDESASDWSVLNHGSTDQPVPEGHYESLSTDGALIGSSPVKRPLISNGPVNIDLGTLPNGTNQEFNRAFAEQVPLFMRHDFTATVPSDDSLADIDVKLPPVYKHDNADELNEHRICKFEGDTAAPSNHKVGSIFTVGSSGWAWGAIGVEVQRNNPYDNEGVAIAAYQTTEFTLRHINFADPALTGETLTDGVLSYNSNIELHTIDFGQTYCSGTGVRVKHGGVAWEQRAATEPTSGNVGGNAYTPSEGTIVFLEKKSTLTGDGGLVKTGDNTTGVLYAGDTDKNYSLNRPGIHEDPNSPATATGTGSITVNLSESYDWVVVYWIAEDTSGVAENVNVEVNGDTGTNYDRVMLDGSSLTGENKWYGAGNMGANETVHGNFTLSGRWDPKCRIRTQLGPALSGGLNAGENSAVTSPLSSVTLVRGQSTNWTVHVYGMNF